MSNFNLFKDAVQIQFAKMIEDSARMYVTSTSGDYLWKIYLGSFPKGSNPIYKSKREYDCNCCKTFIRNIGNVVIIVDNKLISIWDIDVPSPFKEVAAKLAHAVKMDVVENAFLSKENSIGTESSSKMLGQSTVITWEHFYLKLPSSIYKNNSDSIARIKGEIRDSRNVFKRAMEELTLDAGQTILELMEQGSLYKGDEFKSAIKEFLLAKRAYQTVPVSLLNNWSWEASRTFNISRIRNSAIGTLLISISEGTDLNTAVDKFEALVAPTNYKRPKAIYTKRMIEQAQTKIEALGYTNSLGRKHAVLDDITVQDVLFLHRDVKKAPANVFEEMKKDTPVFTKSLAKVEEVSIDHFINSILPKTTSIKVLVESKHQSNLMNLIAPQDLSAISMFKWNNNFSWSYNGDIADSMKQNVKAAGGKIDGILRFSLQWNDNKDNPNDFDAHCIEPKGNLIYFSRKRNATTSGALDVDIIDPGNKVAVENITWSNKAKMQEGRYQFKVHNYSHRGGTSGFTAEIEYNGQIYSYTYDKELQADEKILVADIIFSKTDGITFTKALDATYSQKEIWGIKTNSFVDVSTLTRSPNYWKEGYKSGNQHYFFFLNGCLNPNDPRGFYNEFLQNDLLEHKQVFEALGSKMRVQYSNDQLAGLGFSTTQRNSVIAKVEGSFNRTIKINF